MFRSLFVCMFVVAADDFVRSKSVKLLFEIPRPMQGNPVCGVATLDNELFFSRLQMSQIQVYNATTGAHVRSLPIPDANTCGLVACGFFRCLYFVATRYNAVYKLSLVENSTAMNASPLGGQTACVLACGLSVNRDHNLLVAYYSAHKVQEYTTDGVLVRELNLQPHITYPIQVVELHSGLYGVIHYGRPTGGYSVIDRQGQVVRNFSDEKSLAQLRSTINPSHLPTTDYMPGYSLIEYRNGRVFIAKFANQSDSKILVFHENGKAEFLPDAICGALNGPSCMRYDASTNKLYIGEWSGGRVLCFGMKSTETS